MTTAWTPDGRLNAPTSKHQADAGDSGRAAGWELRLNRVILAALHREFEVRTWNCARFAHACAEAVTGRSIEFRWRGSLRESVDAVLRSHDDPRQAGRGDIVLASVPEPSLGVCVGRWGLFVGKRGVIQVPMKRVSVAWKV